MLYYYNNIKWVPLHEITALLFSDIDSIVSGNYSPNELEDGTFLSMKGLNYYHQKIKEEISGGTPLGFKIFNWNGDGTSSCIFPNPFKNKVLKIEIDKIVTSTSEQFISGKCVMNKYQQTVYGITSIFNPVSSGYEISNKIFTVNLSSDYTEITVTGDSLNNLGATYRVVISGNI